MKIAYQGHPRWAVCLGRTALRSTFFLVAWFVIVGFAVWLLVRP